MLIDVFLNNGWKVVLLSFSVYNTLKYFHYLFSPTLPIAACFRYSQFDTRENQYREKGHLAKTNKTELI